MSATAPSLPSPARHGALSAALGRALLGTLLVIAPLATWAIEPWQQAGLAAALCALGSCACLVHLFRGTRPELAPGTQPLLLFVCAGLVCSLPLAPEGRGTQLAGQDFAGIWAIPARGLQACVEGLAMVVAYISASQLLQGPTQLQRLCALCCTLATLLCFAYLDAPYLQLVPEAEQGPLLPVFGSSANRNHLAAFFGLSCLVGIGGLLGRRHCANHAAPGYRTGQTLWALGSACAALGVYLCASRAAGLGLLLGLGLLFLNLRGQLRLPSAARLWSGAAALLAVLLLSSPVWMDRLAALPTDLTAGYARLGIWRSCLDLWLQAPILGTGPGSLRDLVAAVQDPAVEGRILHAHCDPLELLCERGILGANLLFAAGLLCLRHLWLRHRQVRGDRRRIQVCSIAVGLLVLLGHSLVDLPLQVPGLLLWAVCLAGAASGAMARAHQRRWRLQSLPGPLLWAGLLLCTVGSVEAGLRCRAQLGMQAAGGDANPRPALRAARAIHPGDGRLDFALARAWAGQQPFAAAAVHEHANRGLRRNPFSAEGHLLRAAAQAELDPEAAVPAFRQALRLVPPRQVLPQGFALIRAAAARGHDRAVRSWLRELSSWLGPRAGRLVEMIQAAQLPALLDELPEGVR